MTGTNTLSVTGQVIEVGGGSSGHTTISQAFNSTKSIPLCELIYSNSLGGFEVLYEEASGAGTYTNLSTPCALNTPYSYTISLSNSVLTVTINGAVVYTHTPSAAVTSDQFYFKCGDYDQTAVAGAVSTTPYTEVEDYTVSIFHGVNSPTVTMTSTPVLMTATSTATQTSTLAGSTATSTATGTDSATRTATGTATNSATATATNTTTNTSTSASTSTSTATSTATNSPTASLTQTNTDTPGNTKTSTSTATVTESATNTSTPTVTQSATSTSTQTSTNTASHTATSSASSTATNSPTVTNTPLNTNTATVTNTRTETQTVTSTETVTFTQTFTSTQTSSPTVTSTATVTSSVTATLTPTATTTVPFTSTYTATFTITSTPSNTATPITRTNILPPHPNPITGGLLNIDVQTLGNSSIEMEVFTVAFRRVCDHVTQVSSGNTGTSTTLQWDLHDNMNLPVSNGLYYIRIRVTGTQPTDKVMKVLILR
jgi:hypothetical protein